MGQAKKRRLCPAVGREITAADCGEKRQSDYACPESCPFNPFAAANYSALLETEGRLDQDSVRRLDRETPGGVWPALDAARARNPGHGIHAATVRHLFYLRDTAGRTFAERWAQAGFTGLKNDERVLFRAKMQTRVALLEVHRVLDAERIEAVDLFDPAAKPLLLIDRSIAARAARFSAILTWVYPLPHFWRLSGTGIMIPDMGEYSPDEITLACVAHLGGPVASGEARDCWLVENFARLDDALTATGHERRRGMLAGVDAQFGAATYELRAPWAECRAALMAEPAVADDDLSDGERGEGFAEALVWFAPSPSGVPTTLPGQRVLGRVLLAADRIRLETVGSAKFDELRARFEARLGERVKFSKERRDDHGARMAAQEPRGDPALVPPVLLEQPMRVELSSSRVAPPPPGMSLADYSAQLKYEQIAALADTPLPVLGGRTPRDAAVDLFLRPRLLAVMKLHVRALDENNLRSGRRDDLNALLRELGLTEIDFPPPPPRAVPRKQGEADETDEAWDESAGTSDDAFPFATTEADPTRRAAAPLIGAPFSFEEALERLDTALSFATASEAIDELGASGSTLLDDMSVLSEPWLDDHEFAVFTSFLLQAWFALVPRGVRAPELRNQAMAAELSSCSAWLARRDELSVTAVERFVKGSRQPALLQALVGGLVQGAEAMPKKDRPSPDGVVGMVVCLRVLVDEIDFARRR